MSASHIKRAGSDPPSAIDHAAIDHAEDSLARLRAVAAQPDSEINLGDADAPEVTDWSGASRGQFYRPVKQLKSLRLDADVLAWFQAQGPGYQTRINDTLRAVMLAELRAKMK